MTDGPSERFAYRLGELAERVGGRVEGDALTEITGVATLEDAGPGQLSFLTHPRYRALAVTTRASALLVGPTTQNPGTLPLLRAEEPSLALARLLELYHPAMPPVPAISADARVDPTAVLGAGVGIGPFAVIEAGVCLGEGVVIGPTAVIGRDSSIGARSQIRAGAVLYPGTSLGRDCLIHAGVVLGADGFGFATSGGKHHKLPHVGRVVLGDEVEVGANSAIDRAMLGSTSVGDGSKIDDLVMLAHGVHVEAGALLAAQSGVAGSTHLGGRARLAGQAGVAGHLKLGDGVTVAAKSAVFGDLDDGAFVAGIPAVDHRRWKRAQAALRDLPELLHELRRLRARVEALERTIGGD